MNKKKLAKRLVYISLKAVEITGRIVLSPSALIADAIDKEGALEGIELYKQESKLYKKHGQ